MSMIELTDIEKNIIDYIWRLDEKISVKELLSYYNLCLDENMKKQTLTTTLNRLVNKGLLKKEIRDNGAVRFSFNYPQIKQFEYNEKIGNNILNIIYHCSIGQFIV